MSIGGVNDTQRVNRMSQATVDKPAADPKTGDATPPGDDAGRPAVAPAIQQGVREMMRAIEQGIERGIENDPRREAGIKKLCPRGGRCRAEGPVRGLGPPTDVA